MAIKNTLVNHWVYRNWVRGDVERLLDAAPEGDHTFLVVFGPAQARLAEHFEKRDDINILFKSEPACNVNYPRFGPRNTLYVVEKK